MTDKTAYPISDDRPRQFNHSWQQVARKEAEREMAERFALAQMDNDLEEAAERWGVSNIMRAVWSQAFQRGFIEGQRKRGGDRD